MEQVFYDKKPQILTAAGVSCFFFVTGPIAFFSGATLLTSAYLIHNMRSQNSKKLTNRRVSKNYIR